MICNSSNRKTIIAMAATHVFYNQWHPLYEIYGQFSRLRNKTCFENYYPVQLVFCGQSRELKNVVLAPI